MSEDSFCSLVKALDYLHFPEFSPIQLSDRSQKQGQNRNSSFREFSLDLQDGSSHLIEKSQNSDLIPSKEISLTIYCQNSDTHDQVVCKQKKKRILVPIISCKYYKTKLSVEWSSPFFIKCKHLMLIPFQSLKNIESLRRRFSSSINEEIKKEVEHLPGKIYKFGNKNKNKSLYIAQISQRRSLREYNDFMLGKTLSQMLHSAQEQGYTTIVIPEIRIDCLKTKEIVETTIAIVFKFIRESKPRRIRNIVFTNYNKYYFQISSQILSKINDQYLRAQF